MAKHPFFNSIDIALLLNFEKLLDESNSKIFIYVSKMDSLSLSKLFYAK
jgi:hypothetical protein